jgi:putative zinc finger protein
MPELPKIVRQRLQAVQRSDHPDADVLAAFAEQSLPGSDRAVVMEHLARCGDCREVLALALPEIEEVKTEKAVASPVALRRPWLSMPVLRWGAIAAALVAIVSVGLLRYWPHAPEKMTVSRMELERADGNAEKVNASPQPRASMNEAQTQALLVNPSSSSADKIGSVAAPAAPNPSAAKKVSAFAAPRARGMNSKSFDFRQPAGIAGALPAPNAQPPADALKSEPKQASGGENLVAKNAPSSSRMSAQSETVEVSGASPVVSTEQSSPALNQQAQVQIDQAQVSQPVDQLSDQQSSSDGRTPVGKAKAPVTAQAVAGAVSGRNFSTIVPLTPAAAAPNPAPRWTITPGGGLQRSFDQGKTWQDVFVAADHSLASTTLQVESVPHYAKKSAQANAAQLSVPSPVFRAISAAGLEVWAGASAGVLYHSLDAGDHWTSAVPSDHGIFLTGEIVSVEFTDALHGKIATSTSEVWTTGDGGQHWSRQ